MRKLLLSGLLFLCLVDAAIAAPPLKLGGFTLDTDIEMYKGQVKTETTLPIRFMESLKELEIYPVPGFKSGYLAYGTCAAPGKIVRIKLKYRDSSKSMYEKLLEAYKERFGNAKWLGDPFHVISLWKWSFVEGDTQVDLYLQHNLSDADEKFGNSVKMTLVNRAREEIECFTAAHPDFRKKLDQQKGNDDEVEWEDLLPR